MVLLLLLDTVFGLIALSGAIGIFAASCSSGCAVTKMAGVFLLLLGGLQLATAYIERRDSKEILDGIMAGGNGGHADLEAEEAGLSPLPTEEGMTPRTNNRL